MASILPEDVLLSWFETLEVSVLFTLQIVKTVQGLSPCCLTVTEDTLACAPRGLRRYFILGFR